MMNANPRNMLFAAAVLIAGLSHAGEAEVRKAWDTTIRIPVTSVTKSGYLGLYEVFAGGEVYYTDEKVTAVLHGDLIDAKTRKSITQDRLQKLTAIKFFDLPLEQAVKQVRGNGKRLLATFEDPNCGYCKRLARDMGSLDDVTIYTFLYPILSSDSKDKSERIWCAQDRAKAWNDWMIRGVEPPAKPAACDTAAIAKNSDLGNRLGIRGTPNLFFANGERAPGAIPVAEIESRLKNAIR